MITHANSPSAQKFQKPKTAGLSKSAMRLSKRISAYERDHKGKDAGTRYTKPGSRNQGKH